MPEPSPENSARLLGVDHLTAALNLDQVVDDSLILTTLSGAEDYLHHDLLSLVDLDVTARRPAAITIRIRGTLRSLHISRLYSVAAIPLTGGLEQGPELSALTRSEARGMLSALTIDRPVRFRVGVGDSSLRKQVVGRVEATLGWSNSPSAWDVNLTVAHGRWTAQIGAMHYSRRFPGYDRRPWSTNPLVAETLIRLAKLTPGSRVHDPCCCTGTVLIAAGYNAENLRLSGTDHDPGSLSMAVRNLTRHHMSADLQLADALPIPAPSQSVDRIVTNLPFGKQVGSHDNNLLLYPALLRESERVLTRTGRGVLLTEDKGLLRDAVQRTKGLKIVKERLLRYRGATPTAFTLTRTRR